MSHYYHFVPKDGVDLPWIFKEFVDRAVPKAMYKKYACPLCSRIDAGAALSAVGLDSSFAGSTGKRDLVETYDYMYVVSSKLRALLEAACDEVVYYEVQNPGDSFVIWPKHLIMPDGSGAFDRSEWCDGCKVFRATVNGPERLTNVPNVTIGAKLLEGPQGPMPSWFVNLELARRLKAAKLKGVDLIAW
jgi:hypothetical protein